MPNDDFAEFKTDNPMRELIELSGFNLDFEEKFLLIKEVREEAKIASVSISRARQLRGLLDSLTPEQHNYVYAAMGENYWSPGKWSCGDY